MHSVLIAKYTSNRADYFVTPHSVADPGFSRGGALTLWEMPTYDFTKCSQNFMKLEEFGPGGWAFKIVLCRSATDTDKSYFFVDIMSQKKTSMSIVPK